MEGEDEAPSRDLFVYVDGRFVARLESRPDIGGRSEVRLRRLLEPGPHTLRLTRERHERRGGRGDRRWRHDTRVCPDLIELAIEPGNPPVFELEWIESPFAPADRGPLSWRILVDGERTAGQERSGTPKSEWPPLCEDIEAAVESGAVRAAVVRQDLASCVRWADLWPAAAPAPSCAEVLVEIERAGFGP